MDHPAGDPSTPLSVAMREGSRREHEQAEGTDFVSDLLAGRAHPHQYAAYLARLRDVYAALEQAVRDHRDDPVVAAGVRRVVVPPRRPRRRPRRLVAGRGPVERLAGGGPLPGADRPRAGRASTAGGAPLHPLPGRPVRRPDARAGDAPGYEGLDRGGLAFYEFGAIPKPVAYKRAYRDRLDGLRLDPPLRAAMVEEVRRAFRLNHALLDEVATLGAGCVTPRCPG